MVTGLIPAENSPIFAAAIISIVSLASLKVRRVYLSSASSRPMRWAFWAPIWARRDERPPFTISLPSVISGEYGLLMNCLMAVMRVTSGSAWTCGWENETHPPTFSLPPTLTQLRFEKRSSTSPLKESWISLFWYRYLAASRSISISAPENVALSQMYESGR